MWSLICDKCQQASVQTLKYTIQWAEMGWWNWFHVVFMFQLWVFRSIELLSGWAHPSLDTSQTLTLVIRKVAPSIIGAISFNAALWLLTQTLFQAPEQAPVSCWHQTMPPMSLETSVSQVTCSQKLNLSSHLCMNILSLIHFWGKTNWYYIQGVP